MSSYDFQLTEEIARWRFEVLVHERPSWFVAFTNPTAGPWKRVLGRDRDGKEGEVYRFPRDSDRPDLILVCDELRSLAIIEAKDSMAKLMVDAQITKSAQVVNDLARTLSGLKHNAFWGSRSDYTVCPGLLWGGERASSAGEREALVLRFATELRREAHSAVCRDCLCIEVLKQSRTGVLDVGLFLHAHTTGTKAIDGRALLSSLRPDTR